MTVKRATEADHAVLDETVRFFHEDLGRHFSLEEDLVLPSLEAKIGRYGTLVSVIAYEHDEIRREIVKFQEAREALASDPQAAIEELNRHGIFTIQFLWDHFRKERTSLFPTARAELSQGELERIGDELGRR